MTDRPFQLQGITVGDDPGAWSAAGFTVDQGHVTIGNTVIELVGRAGRRGIRHVTVYDLSAEIDGLAFTGSSPPTPRPAAHPNRVERVDHLVAMSPDMDRTTDALIAARLDHRRTRRFEVGGTTKRQEFFWLGNVILELAGEDLDHGPGPAILWGLALTCNDLDAAATTLGDGLGSVKPAAQRGRRIATVRTRDLDISVPIALMSPHPSEDRS